MMLRILAALLLAILPAHACLWDRDTLRDEAKGKLDTVKAITGWFDRYPPKYYEMRLERVTKELREGPADLNLYDDAGVACSRLGRNGEAIAWMEKKKAVLDALPDGGPADGRYRYLSNAGTFHLIRWIVRPEAERNADLADLKASKDFIAGALEVNPDAHFGREKFQLMLIKWLLDPQAPPTDYYDPNFLADLDGKTSKHFGGVTFEEARKGITGLIQLGAAWESIDTIYALEETLSEERNTYLARLAYLRMQELLKEGKQSLHPSQAIREEVAKASFTGLIYGQEQIDGFYKDARAAAMQRGIALDAYQEQRFEKGMHPDTHPDFWKDWQEPVSPEMPSAGVVGQVNRHPERVVYAVFAGALAGILALVIRAWMGHVKRQRQKRAPLST